MSKRLILPTGRGPLLKSHVEGYTRKDGTVVKPHDDKRQKKADPYSHPHAVGKAVITDEHSTGAHDASTMQFAGTDYASTGKQGKSFHDETPVREFESQDGHRVWMDHHSRVHADSKDEVPKLRAKFEAHTAGQAEGGGASPGKDPASGGAGASGGDEQKIDKATILAATLGQHNAAAGYISVPIGKGQDKVEGFVNAVKSHGFSLDEGTTYDPNGDAVQLDKNEQGKAVLTNPAGQRVVIMASDGGDRVKISVSVLDKAPDKAEGGAEGASGGSKASEGAGGADKPAGGVPKAKANTKPETGIVAEGNKLAYGKDDPKGEGVASKGAKWADLKKHPMHSESDLAYFKGKGYSPAEIKEIWDRDHAAGHKPVEHKQAPDVVGVAADPDHYKKGKGQGSLFKSIADGVRLLLKSDVHGYSRKDGTAVKPYHRASRVEGEHHYEYSNGKKPRGQGAWLFSAHKQHDHSKHSPDDLFEHSGTYSDAKAAAAKWGQSKGHAVVHLQS